MKEHLKGHLSYLGAWALLFSKKSTPTEPKKTIDKYFLKPHILKP